MSDPVVRRVMRSVEDARNVKGMVCGMPKVTIDASDAERICIMAGSLQSELTAARDEAERLLGRVNELSKSCINLASGIFSASREAPIRAFILRRQAESLENEADQWTGADGRFDAVTVEKEIRDYAVMLRQQADETEKA